MSKGAFQAAPPLLFRFKATSRRMRFQCVLIDLVILLDIDGTPDLPLKAGAAAFFSAIELTTNDLAGEALLWGIDLHNRAAHLGISLRPAFRGRRLGTDVIGVLCSYGFAIRGLNRLQIETLTDNEAMTAAATHAGFSLEGTLRRSAWVNGDFIDEVILGLLAEEWKARQHTIT